MGYPRRNGWSLGSCLLSLGAPRGARRPGGSQGAQQATPSPTSHRQRGGKSHPGECSDLGVQDSALGVPWSWGSHSSRGRCGQGTGVGAQRRLGVLKQQFWGPWALSRLGGGAGLGGFCSLWTGVGCWGPSALSRLGCGAGRSKPRAPLGPPHTHLLGIFAASRCHFPGVPDRT